MQLASLILSGTAAAFSIATFAVVVIGGRHMQSELAIIRAKGGKIKRHFQKALDQIDV